MNRAAAFVALISVIGCASSPVPSTTSPQPAAAASLYTRIPEKIGAFELTERTVVTDVPSDSVFRFRDGSRTTLTVIVYSVGDDVRAEGDPQLWAATEGAKFEELQPIRVSRGQIAAYAEAVSDTNWFSVGPDRLLEHFTMVPVRFRNGTVAVDMQYLYMIWGKFVKVRATVPAEGWKESNVPSFARELARRLAGRR